jgi:hypothetical protein
MRGLKDGTVASIRPVIHIDRPLMAAVLAGHEQATDAMPAHAAERHWADWFVVLGHARKLRTDRERNQVTVIGSS